MSRWRPALRIARRTVRASLGRSLLIAILVGLPVAGATFVDILVRTYTDPQRSATEQIGSADALLQITHRSSIENYHPLPFQFDGRPSGPRRPPSSVDLSSELPSGSNWIEAPRSYPLRLSVGADRIIRPELVVADVSSPLAAHESRLVSGSLPSAADEVLVT